MSVRVAVRRPKQFGDWNSLVRFYRTFGHAVMRHKGLIAAALSSTILSALFEVLKPWPLKIVFDYVLSSSTKRQHVPFIGDLRDAAPLVIVQWSCIALLAISLVAAVCSYCEAYFTAAAGQRVAYRIRKDVLTRLHELPLSFHARRRSGDLLMRLTGDVELVKSFLVPGTIMGVGRAVLMTVMFLAMISLDVTLTLCVIAVAPLLSLLFVRFSLRIREASRRQRQREGDFASSTSESIASVSLVQAYAAESAEVNRILRSSRRSLRAGLQATKLEATLVGLTDVLIAAGTVLVLWVGTMRVLNGYLTPGDVLVFAAYLRGVYKPVRKLTSLAAQSAKATAGGERLVEILRAHAPADPPDAIVPSRLDGALQFEHVTFGYTDETDVLHDISLTIPAGSRVALVGPSGAGKSSLVSLIPRLHDPRAGRILLDGRPLTDYARGPLRERIAVVFQDSLLLGLTVRENIAFGRDDISDADIERAARLARIHDRIARLPNGYDTVLDERGASLSGGEKRRVAIARALVRDASILILDEPTTGADLALELDLTRTLLEQSRGRTAIIINHRFRLIDQTDIVVLIRDGRVRAVGPHERLLAECPEYAAFAASGSDDETDVSLAAAGAAR